MLILCLCDVSCRIKVNNKSFTATVNAHSAIAIYSGSKL